MIAAGAIMGIRVGMSLLAGVVVFFGVLAPLMELHGIIHCARPGLRSGRSCAWTLWPAVALMVTAGLTNFALRWRMITRAMGELTAIFGSVTSDRKTARNRRSSHVVVRRRHRAWPARHASWPA